jgi:NhaA family Na+:H+ antiporter
VLEQTEHALKPWVRFAIVPIFAFVNAGVSLAGVTLSNKAARIPLGIIAGLFVGKQIGVFGTSVIANKPGFAALPEGAMVAKLYGIAVPTGIGFTMSLFIGTLAFDDEKILTQLRSVVLIGSLVSGMAGALLLSAGG